METYNKVHKPAFNPSANAIKYSLEPNFPVPNQNGCSRIKQGTPQQYYLDSSFQANHLSIINVPWKHHFKIVII